MRWYEYLREQQADKLQQIDQLETGDVELTSAISGVARDITADRLAQLKSDIAQMRQVFLDEGMTPDA